MSNVEFGDHGQGIFHAATGGAGAGAGGGYSSTGGGYAAAGSGGGAQASPGAISSPSPGSASAPRIQTPTTSGAFLGARTEAGFTTGLSPAGLQSVDPVRSSGSGGAGNFNVSPI